MTSTMIPAPAEDPEYFDADGVTLFGIHSPPAEANGAGIVLLSGGGATAPATNRNRLSVRLGRLLAARGYHAFRFDYHGIGESSGVLAGAPRVDEPFLADVHGAVGCVRRRGVEEILLVGSCFGARTALAAAPDVPDLSAVVLVSPPLRDLGLEDAAGARLALNLTTRESLKRAARLRTIAGLFRPGRRKIYRRFLAVRAQRIASRLRRFALRDRGVDDSWLGKDFLVPIQRLAERDIPVLFIYGTEDHHYHDWVLARPGRLGKVLGGAPRTELLVMEGWVHGLTQINIQERVADTILDWIRRIDTQRGGA